MNDEETTAPVFDPWEQTEERWDLHTASYNIRYTSISSRCATIQSKDFPDAVITPAARPHEPPRIEEFVKASDDQIISMFSPDHTAPFDAPSEHVRRFLEILWLGSASGLIANTNFTDYDGMKNTMFARQGHESTYYADLENIRMRLKPKERSNTFIWGVAIPSARARIVAAEKFHKLLEEIQSILQPLSSQEGPE